MLAPSPARPETPHVSLRIALGLVAAAARLVSAAERRAWQAEWHAELITHADAQRSKGRTKPATHLELLWRAAGSLVDALYFTLHGFGPGNLAHDLAHAGRALRKRPGFTLTAVVTLAMSGGAELLVGEGATPERLAAVLDRLLSSLERLTEMGAALKRLSRPGSHLRIADLVEAMAEAA